MPSTAGMWAYLKEAFFFRWNVLAVAGATVLAVMSPQPDVLLPLVGAIELAYLAGLTSIPRFRRAIDAKAHAEGKPQVTSGAPPEQALSDMLAGLQGAGFQRFQSLRTRCLDMRRLAHGVRGRTGSTGHADQIRTPALDRLLWVFLRLLFSQQALNAFLDATDEDEIKSRLAGLKERQAKLSDAHDERITRSLTDSIATCEMRLENYGKAESNAEFVDVELDRIEEKIQALTEMAVGHEDPDYISRQVDSVAESMTQTESAIRELNYITGLHDDLGEAPQILDPHLETVMER